MKYIYHHLGLGDHIICNGLVRSLIKPEERYYMFVKPHNLTSVKFMYRDLTNLDFLVGDDTFANNYIKDFSIKRENLIIAGFTRHPNSKEFDDSFYLQNNINFLNRWTKFYVGRDLDSEKKLFDKYNIKENQYVFIHDDHKRNIYIDETHIINNDMPKIRPNIEYSENIFDYCYLMEHSVESHFIDSSFRLIFDSLQLRNNNIYFHVSYKDVIRDFTTKSQSLLNFKII
jgi:hypothetical protein